MSSGVVVDEPGSMREAGGEEILPYSVMDRLGRREALLSASLLSLCTMLCCLQLLRAATRCMNAVPAEVDRCGAFSTSIWGVGAAGAVVGAAVRLRRSLPTAARALWPDSGVFVQLGDRAGRPGSGVRDTDLALPCPDSRHLAEMDPLAMLSLYLKYGESPSRKATQIPVTWTSFFTSSPTAWVVLSGVGSSSMASCSPKRGRM